MFSWRAEGPSIPFYNCTGILALVLLTNNGVSYRLGKRSLRSLRWDKVKVKGAPLTFSCRWEWGVRDHTFLECQVYVRAAISSFNNPLYVVRYSFPTVAPHGFGRQLSVSRLSASPTCQCTFIVWNPTCKRSATFWYTVYILWHVLFKHGMARWHLAYYAGINPVHAASHVKISLSLLFLQSRDDSYWTENHVLSPGSTYVEASEALDSFRTWVRNARSSLPPSDHWMLFTGYAPDFVAL